ncbi:MAG: alpha/beta hydrolase [Ruminococcaceae bacterium]|nr:alpha/beta hydrolase [Oscillospiraceae bacterium]
MTTESARKKLEKLKPMLNSCSIKTARVGQDMLGVISSVGKKESCEKLEFPNFTCGVIMPEAAKNKDAALIYIHGGGYVAGGFGYAKAYAMYLSEKTGLKTFFPAYRLAPENKCPDAVKDCVKAYKYIVESLEYDPKRIILIGESAGGGLIYSLCAALKKLSLPLPLGLIAISPWTDLTMSGQSYKENAEIDPSMSIERLQFFAENYTVDPKDPLASPLFGDLSELPPSLIVSGGDEIMLSDAVSLHEKLLEVGSPSRHHIEEGLWHAYPLYHLTDVSDAVITDFIKELLQ